MINIPDERIFTFPILMPREYQLETWKAYSNGIKNLIISYPRRAGKDVLSVSIAVDYALNNPNSAIILLAPTKLWARRIYWTQGQSNTVSDPITGHERDLGGSLLDICLPKCLRQKTNNSDAKIYLHNGSTIELQGSDEATFVGQRVNCVVISESARHKSSVFSLLSPVLEESNGLTIYNGTVETESNHFCKMIENGRLLPEDYHVNYQTLHTIKSSYMVSPPDEDGLREFNINPELEGKINPLNNLPYKNTYKRIIAGESKSYVVREYVNIPTSVEEGSYYDNLIQIIEGEGRISDNVLYNPTLPVFTALDIGISDHTSIVWFQYIEQQITFIDSYEKTGEPISHYIDIIRSKPYKYAGHFAPHDSSKRSIETGMSLLDYCRRHHNFVFNYIPKTNSVIGDIQVIRGYFPRMSFVRGATRALVCALEGYRENLTTGKPKHDQNSHFADAFRYAIMAIHKGLLIPNAAMHDSNFARRTAGMIKNVSETENEMFDNSGTYPTNISTIENWLCGQSFVGEGQL